MRPDHIPLARRRFQFIASTVVCSLFGVVSVTAAADPLPDKAPREQVSTPSDAPPGLNDAVEPADTSATISEIRVQGNKAVSSGYVIASIKLAVGNPFDAQLMGNDIKRLMRSGFFNAVKIRREAKEDGTLRLIIDVEEGRVIRYVKIVGSTKPEKTLARKAGLRIGDPFDPAAVERTRAKLEGYLHGTGYQKAKVTIVEGDKPDDRGVRLMVEEGDRSNISGFSVSLPGATQKPIVMSFRGGIDENKVDKHAAQLVDHYRALGYFQARAGREWTLDEKQQVAQVKILIDEGPRYVVKQISFHGNVALDGDKLRDVMRLEPGDHYAEVMIEKDEARLLDAYANAGYLFAKLRRTQRFPERATEVDLAYEVTEGAQFRVDRVVCHLTGEDQRVRQQALVKDLPQANALADKSVFRDWSELHRAILQITLENLGAAKILLRPTSSAGRSPAPDRLQADESIEVELVPVVAAAKDGASE